MDTEAADKLHVDVNRVEMPPAEIAAGAHVGSLQAYRDLYQQSIEHPDVFWSEVC
jgi:acetyl-CoA synthetase